MRTLQFIMTAIFLVCFGWLSLILGGPWIIEKYFSLRIGETVQFIGIDVSPRLAVTARRIQFGPEAGHNVVLYGAKLDWKISPFDNSRITLSAARADLRGKHHLHNPSVSIAGGFGSETLMVSGAASELDSTFLGVANNITFTGFTDWSFDRIRGAEINASDFTYRESTSLKTSSVDIRSENIRIGQYVTVQNFEGLITNLATEAVAADFKVKEMQLGATFGPSSLDLAVNFRDISTNSHELSASRIAATAAYDLSTDTLASPAKLRLKDVVSNSLNIQTAEAEFISTDSHFGLSSVGELELKEILFDGRYFGRLPSARYEVEVLGNRAVDGSHLSGTGRLQGLTEPLSLDLKLDVSSHKAPIYLDCLTGTCDLDEIIVRYDLNVKDTSLLGEAACSGVQCVKQDFNFSFETENTAQFFNDIAELKIVNPIVLAGAYAQLQNGEKSGQGHLVEY